MRRILIVAVLALGIPVAYFFIAGQKHQAKAPVAKQPAPAVGALAPDFTLTDMNGKSLSLSQFRGKVVLVNFWATWCPPCRAEMPSIERLYRRLEKHKNFVLLTVNVNEDNSKDSVKAFTEETPLSFPILLDRDNRVAGRYQVNGIPQTFIIDPNGVIVQKVVGGRDWDSPPLVDYLSSLLKGA